MTESTITTPELIRFLKCGGADSENQAVAGEEIERLNKLAMETNDALLDERLKDTPTNDQLRARVEELEREIELHRKAQQVGPVICRHVAGQLVWSNCPECGPNVALDDDGCCKSCGRDALWSREW